MNTQFSGAFQIALALAAFACPCINAQSDTVFVWSYDGTIRQVATNGVGSVLASNGVPGGNGPVGLALDNAGNLYSGCPGTSRVVKYTTNGVGSDAGFYDSVSGLAFDRIGRLYMTIPNYVCICSAQGYYLGPTNCTQSHLSYPISLAFDRSGRIFVANAGPPYYCLPGEPTNTVAMFSADLTYLGDFATNLNLPWGLAFDRTGDLFVSNSGTDGAWNNCIFRINTNGFPFLFASFGLNNPRGLAFDSAGNLYVANAGDGTIRKFTPDGTGSVFATGLTSPTSIAIHPGLKLWATSTTLDNATMLPGGAFQFTFANTPGASFSALVTTNVSLPVSNWTVLGGVSETSSGCFQFTDPQATNHAQRFYRVVAN